MVQRSRRCNETLGLMAIRKCVVAVPARLQSSRLPNKVLADIGGKPMIQRVLERCRQARSVEAVVLCTDSAELKTQAEGWGFPVLMTAESCSSGSERIASVPTPHGPGLGRCGSRCRRNCRDQCARRSTVHRSCCDRCHGRGIPGVRILCLRWSPPFMGSSPNRCTTPMW